MTYKTSIKFINHASISIRHGDVSLLSDPWYQGDAFNKGWNLLHELNDDEVMTVLEGITHIWISHEHPDHFSISFFKKFGQILKDYNIQILFQRTKDKRVENFILKSGYRLRIIDFNKWIELSKDFKILCFKDGFYDSGLAIQTSDKKIINLNDCEIKDKARCKEVLKITGECDILASQYSYAAWKGGAENPEWRQLAAKEKIQSLKLQAHYFKPKVIIPFASFVYFSNSANFYLNDAANTPSDVIESFSGLNFKIKVMKPFDILLNLDERLDNKQSLNFWNKKFNSINGKTLTSYDVIEFHQLQKSFKNYIARIFKNNAKWFMRITQILSPIAAFKPLIVRLTDLNINVNLDIFGSNLEKTHKTAHISMSSESLNFIFNNTFGFDTLTVNGCFEEEIESGFSRAARILAIENLNNMGIKFRPGIIFDIQLMIMFISRLWEVSKKIKSKN